VRYWQTKGQLYHTAMDRRRAVSSHNNSTQQRESVCVLCGPACFMPAEPERERVVWPHGWVWVMILTKAAATLLITTRGRNTNAHTQHRTMTKQSVHRTHAGQTFKKPFPKLISPIHTDALFHRQFIACGFAKVCYIV
jgi:hypothetical protein